MQISNRMLLVLLVAAVALVATAVWLTLKPPQVAVEAPQMSNTPLVVTAMPTVERQAGSGWVPSGPTTVSAPPGFVAKLDCDGLRKERAITDGIATFNAIPVAGCSLELAPAAPDDGTAKQSPVKPFYPLLPGDAVDCLVDNPNGKETVVCTNSLAEIHAATLVVSSGANGHVSVDGKPIGPVPVQGYRLSVGRHTVTFTGEHATQDYPLTVRADEFVNVQFIVPTRDMPTAGGPVTTPAAPLPSDVAPGQTTAVDAPPADTD